MRAIIVGLTIAALAAGGATAAEAWARYSDPQLGFSVDTPQPLTWKTLQVPSPKGPVPTTIGTVELPDKSLLAVSVADFTGLNATADTDDSLDGAVLGVLANTKAELDSETKITVNGAAGRDITFHTDKLKARARIVRSGDRLYDLIGVGLAERGPPVEFQRMEDSFSLAAP
jgi:hypothetical protein